MLPVKPASAPKPSVSARIDSEEEEEDSTDNGNEEESSGWSGLTEEECQEIAEQWQVAIQLLRAKISARSASDCRPDLFQWLKTQVIEPGSALADFVESIQPEADEETLPSVEDVSGPWKMCSFVSKLRSPQTVADETLCTDLFAILLETSNLTWDDSV